jgi:hypothetical protein
MTPQPQNAPATRESVLREFFDEDSLPVWTDSGGAAMAKSLADARNEVTSLESEIEHTHRVASMIEVGLRREIGLLQAENASQRAYNNTLMDDTVALRETREENERLRALVASQGEPAAVTPLWEGWGVVDRDGTTERPYLGQSREGAIRCYDHEQGHALFAQYEPAGLARCIPVQIVAKQVSE